MPRPFDVSFIPLAVLVLLLPGAWLQAEPLQDRDSIQQALERPVMNGSQTLAEVQDYAELRIPRMPELKTVESWKQEADRLRTQVLDEVVFRGEAAKWRRHRGAVEWLGELPGGPGYVIKKLRYEAMPGFWYPALLYEPSPLPSGDGKLPVVINVNGHEAVGKSADYKQLRCINQAKRGILAMNLEWLDMGQLKNEGNAHDRLQALDLCGTSGISIHFLAIQRALDAVLDHPRADSSRVGLTGLSGGGWQTIFFSPLDPRVTLASPVAGYSSFLTRIRHFEDLGDFEQTPTDLATVLDYTHLTAMLAPHPTLLMFNQRDSCCFAAPHAMPPLMGAAAPVFSLFDREDALRVHVNLDPGDHNYEVDNRQAFYRLMRDFWFADDSGFDAAEIPSESELKTADELSVPLPADNLTLHEVSLRLAENLPAKRQKPTDADALAAWNTAERKRLADLVKPVAGEVSAQQVAEETHDGLTATYWRLKVGEAWTVPAVELSRGESQATALVIADAGRKGAASRLEKELAAGRRVVVIDPFYFGEAVPSEKDYLWGLIVGTLGGRPLGLQAGQTAAVARWLAARENGQAPVLVSQGPRSGVVALAAAALEEKAIAGVETHEALSSLREVLTRKLTYREAPELFCFGLLADFDLDTMGELVAPRPLSQEPGAAAGK